MSPFTNGFCVMYPIPTCMRACMRFAGKISAIMSAASKEEFCGLQGRILWFTGRFAGKNKIDS